MRIAILGPGGVGGLLAGALTQAGTPVTVLASEAGTAKIARDGLRVSSVRFGELHVRPEAVSTLEQPVDALLVATKATSLPEALERVRVQPPLTLPLLNGVEHMRLLRSRFPPESVLAGAIRVESDRPEPGVIVHTSPSVRIDVAGAPAVVGRVRELAGTLEAAGIETLVRDSEPEVMWGKLVRLNALACTTSAYDMRLGAILSTPELREQLIAAIEETAAVAAAEGAAIDPSQPLGELVAAHASLRSSMQRDIAAGRVPELDAIGGAVLRAATRHGLPCPTVERLVAAVCRRAGMRAGAGGADSHWRAGADSHWRAGADSHWRARVYADDALPSIIR
ncbi:MAG: ketopantoate reductase family protein [Solirubrobacteraceae bacterium]